MKKRKKTFIIVLLVLVLFLFGCTTEPTKEPHKEHIESDWQLDGEFTCGEDAIYIKVCTVCGEVLDMKTERITHDFEETTIEPTCTEDGQIVKKCKKCGYERTQIIAATGHEIGPYVIKERANKAKAGTRALTCAKCGEELGVYEYSENECFYNVGHNGIFGVRL